MKAAKKFMENWAGHGYERGEAQKFWIDLLANVFGVEDIASFIFFEEQVKDRIQNKTITNFIDAYIPSTRVMIEQKSGSKDLREPVRQSDGTLLTPFQQAKKYVADLPLSQHPKWIVTCNFEEFLIYDMENPNCEPAQLFLKDLEKEYYRLQFLVDQKSGNIRREEEISLRAGELVGKLYDALYKEYINPDEKSLRSLNILCVRIVFCLYAEDAGLFGTKTSFEDYVRSFAVENLRDGIIKLFRALDKPNENRDKYETKLAPFPYVNGGLFRDEDIEIPNFTDEIVDVIVKHCAPFNWSEISPTIFGAVFESTLNPESRRKGGMHYTSIQNIHKVIDPLFMDELNAEFDAICQVKAARQKSEKLLSFQNKLGGLKFLDPACGSGNFLTETYLSLRRLENKVISILNKGEKVLGFDDYIKVRISQFYGIEINDFAVTVAKTALWIAESQMVAETEAIISQDIEFLPLKTGANIVEGNALRMDWATLAKKGRTGFLFADKLNVYKIDAHHGEVEVRSPAEEAADMPPGGTGDGKHYKELNVIAREVEEKELPEKRMEPVAYDYIIGNPPFSGAQAMDKDGHQKQDILDIFAGMNGAGNLDYVCCWYKKAADFIRGTQTRVAFVSTNSIVQGEHVAVLWKPLLAGGVSIDFAYRSFRWYSESSDMAHVHCVIISFSDSASSGPGRKQKFLFDSDGNRKEAKHINAYLLDMPDVFVESSSKPLCPGIPKINKGSQPTDGGNLIIKPEDYEDFVKREPAAKKFIREYLGSEEFINGKKRYCLWLSDASPAELRKMPLVMKRIEAVKAFRLASKKKPTNDWAAYPYLFTENRQPESGNYLLIPRVSSERRRYVPIGYVSSDVIASDAVQMVPNATLYDFGILTSNVHNSWMRAVCGRLKSDYRYSNTIVYNTFPWCSPTDSQKAVIEGTARAILDARAKYPDSSLADLYDETTMPPDLRKAHQANDKAVMEAYGFSMRMSESECVAELFKLNEKLAAAS